MKIRAADSWCKVWEITLVHNISIYHTVFVNVYEGSDISSTCYEEEMR